MAAEPALDDRRVLPGDDQDRGQPVRSNSAGSTLATAAMTLMRMRAEPYVASPRLAPAGGPTAGNMLTV